MRPVLSGSYQTDSEGRRPALGTNLGMAEAQLCKPAKMLRALECAMLAGGVLGDNPALPHVSRGLGQLSSLSDFAGGTKRGDKLVSLSSGASFGCGTVQSQNSALVEQIGRRFGVAGNEDAWAVAA